jgi:hypothetical protein
VARKVYNTFCANLQRDHPDKIKTTGTLFIAMGWDVDIKLPII